MLCTLCRILVLNDQQMTNLSRHASALYVTETEIARHEARYVNLYE
jgi:hypothetical protein